MKLYKRDLKMMRSSLTSLAVATLCSTALILFATQQSELAQQDWHLAQRQLRAAQTQFDNAKQDQDNVDSYLGEYTASLEQKLIGTETRLDWVENLEKLRAQKLVVGFRYSIEPQKLYAAQPAIASGNFDIHYSRMKLELELLHEGQLITFLDALRNQIKGWYHLERCEIKRNATEHSNNIGLHAECDGGWITLQNRSIKP